MGSKRESLLLMLLAALLPMAWVSAQTVNIPVMKHGSVMADLTTAMEGQTVTLTVSPVEGYRLKAGTLLVEKATEGNSDQPELSSRRAPAIGVYISVTQTAPDTYTFVMPDGNVMISATFFNTNTFTTEASSTESTDATKKIEGSTITMTPSDDGSSVVVNQVQVTESAAAIAVTIPGTVTDVDGNSYVVTGVAAGTFYGQTNVTDIYLPDTEEAINIEEGAFTLDSNTDENHQVVTIHTPLSLLDDYALLQSLSENYNAGRISATATPMHRYWTFSCGVDIALPEGVRLFTVKATSAKDVEITEEAGAQIIKANNGVLLACPDNEGNAYEMIVSPSADRPSGMTPATDNARTYDGNMLEPVINGKHFEANEGYHILYDNEFYPIADEDEGSLIPACKAVLKLPHQ